MTRWEVLVADILAGTTVVGRENASGSEGLLAAARRPGGEPVRTETETILPGTRHETPLYVVDAPKAGPTAMVTGGIHGDEPNGIEVAREAASWYPDAGRLVVIPEANRVAIENGRRDGVGGDLNRQFPPERPPETELARGLWAAISRHAPDVFLDLHRSLGIYGVHPRYVGQAIFHSPSACGEELAAYLNEVAIPWYMPFHRFTAATSMMGGPLLFHAVDREFGADAYLFETTAFLLDQKTKNELTRHAVAKVLALHGLLDAGDGRRGGKR